MLNLKTLAYNEIFLLFCFKMASFGQLFAIGLWLLLNKIIALNACLTAHVRKQGDIYIFFLNTCLERDLFRDKYKHHFY